MNADRRNQRLKKHLVLCPHCGKEVLDHMTECYFCKGKLTPKGYTPIIDDKTKSRLRWIIGTIMVVVSLTLFAIKYLF